MDNSDDILDDIEDFDMSISDDSIELPFGDEPAELNIINALDAVQLAAHKSRLSIDFWAGCATPIEYLCDKLSITREEAVLLAIICESGTAQTWRSIGDFLGMTRLQAMSLTPHIEDLKKRRWIYACMAPDCGGKIAAVRLTYGALKAFRFNRPFVPECIENLTEQSLVDRIASFVQAQGSDGVIFAEDAHRFLLQLAESNTHLPLGELLMSLNSNWARITLMIIVGDFARYGGTDGEGVDIYMLNNWFEPDLNYNNMIDELQNGQHELFRRGLIEFACQDGMVDTAQYKLTDMAKKTYLAKFKSRRQRRRLVNDSDLLHPRDIKAKPMFYNAQEKAQLDRLTSLLGQKQLSKVQKRLAASGLRRGITCLFYGAPGTGKTESVLQLARATGRDIMQVDIAGLRDKFVGESEKNIKGIFNRYRELCEGRRKMPILFFNESDAIINNRLERTGSSIEKMDNAMQNIILQELENLDGILIATTNLTGTLDKAFDRRFLFKFEFNKPGAEARRAIWHSMLPDVGEADCGMLSDEFDFSGGQIENIARKCKIEYAISGEQPSMSRIRDFCNEEFLNRKSHVRIGF